MCTINVKEQNIDMLSLSGHKFHGPKGVGVLYITQGRHPAELYRWRRTGARPARGGTENVASIVGLATAMEQAMQYHGRNGRESCAAMRDKLIDGAFKD